MTRKVRAELVRLGELTEVAVNDPGATKSGTCALCETLNGKPISQVGAPPYHKHCACKTEMVQLETQPSKVIDEYDFEPAKSIDDLVPQEDGGVVDLGDDELSKLLENL